MKLKRILKEYFTYTSGEKNGLIGLSIILIAVLVVPSLFTDSNPGDLNSVKKDPILDSLLTQFAVNKAVEIEKFSFDPNLVTLSQMQRLGFTDFQIRNLCKYREAGGIFQKVSDLSKIYGIESKDLDKWKDCIVIPKRKTDITKSASEWKPKVESFTFDPNLISIQDWIRLGVKEKIAQRIKKYLSSGARFEQAEDLRKIYGLDSLSLKRIIPLIRISKREVKTPKKLLVDINVADTTQLMLLPGIGPVLSRRIIKYRELLGGFYQKEQMLEVYGIHKTNYQKIVASLRIGKAKCRTISINKSNSNQLSHHPYISKRLALDIIRYRNRKGKYAAVEDLNNKHIVDDSLFQKLKLYLSVD